MVAAGHTPVTLACSWFAPTNAARMSQHGETRTASRVLTRVRVPASVKMARSMFKMRILPESAVGKGDVRQHPAQPRGRGPGSAAGEAEHHRKQDEPDEEGIKEHRDTEDHPHLLGWQRAGQSEGEED